MIRLTKLLILSLFLAIAAACGSDGEDACDDVTCLDGTTCIVQDSGPACVPN
jgi:hypothetical protein